MKLKGDNLKGYAIVCDRCGFSEIGRNEDEIEELPNWFTLFHGGEPLTLDFCGWSCLTLWSAEQRDKLIESGLIVPGLEADRAVPKQNSGG